MSDSLLPPIPEQKLDISIDLDDAMLEILLLGIYTAIYFGTSYVYQPGGRWRHSGDNLHYFNTGWKTLFNDICAFLLATLGDGLLIWRCFNVWNRSLLVILLPLFLLLSTITIASASKLEPSPYQGSILDILTAATFCVTSATTLLTTFLIAYRIYSFSKQDLLKRSRMRFRNIVEILAQSAAGVAPAIMVARLALAPSTDEDMSTITHISGLQFDHNTIANGALSRGDSVSVETRPSSVLGGSEKLKQGSQEQA
ncbi:hypothetical protein CPB84DRAFT_1751285 [Gymnopilus junonius]|uniref:Uncharacterized protein n=1 Tax=Gymnopilus junonius TaxID=109634 RepID=A0A9P5NE94_GYMJU|nr:hypothetical protein CPB84DRAFT_1751285 [Gymnopilus junonius]